MIMTAEQQFLENYRIEVQEYLSSTTGSYAHERASQILDNMRDEWDTHMGEVDSLNKIWDEESRTI